MPSIKKIRLNQYELDHGFKDQVALSTAWSPLVKGSGSSIQALKVEGDKVMVTWAGDLLPLVLLSVTGLGVMWPTLQIAFATDVADAGERLMASAFMILGLILFLVPFLARSRRRLLTIDLEEGRYFRGRGHHVNKQGAEDAGRVADIYAVQVLRKAVLSLSNHNEHRDRTSTRYELNLVLRDGSRVNVMNHATSEEISSAAEVLKTKLGVPVWKVSFGCEPRSAEIPVKLADIDGPIANTLDWTPLNRRIRYKTYRLDLSPQRLTVFPNVWAIMKHYALLGGGFAVLGVEAIISGEVGISYMMIFFVGALLLIGMLQLARLKPLVFDKGRGLYFRGSKHRTKKNSSWRYYGMLKDIHAIQLIVINPGPRQSEQNVRNEVNLVFGDRRRMPVLASDNTRDVEQAALSLADFLGVPVWRPIFE